MSDTVRIGKWDNVKGALIVFVVLGHVIESFTGRSSNARSLFLFIYTFHMPLFIFVSGLFSKRCVREKDYKRVVPFLTLYFFIKIFRSAALMLIKHSFSIRLFVEDGAPWYCLMIFFCYLITIGVRNADKKYVLICSIILACFAGYDKSIGDELVLSRLIVYYPFFYLGYCLEAKDLEKIFADKRVRIISAISLIGFAAYIYLRVDAVYWLRPLLTGRNPFSKLGEEYADWGALIRLCYYFVSAFISACVIAVIPNRSKIMTLFGKRSLQIYALHFAVLQMLLYRADMVEILELIWPSHYVWLTIPVSIGIVLLCSIKIFGVPFDYIRRNGEPK